MIEQRLDAAGLLPRPLPLSENFAANAALLARLSSLPVSRPPFPFAPGSLPPGFLSASGAKMSPLMSPPHPMLASLPQLPEIRARLLGLQFPPRQQDSQSPQFSPPGFLGNFNFNRDGSDSPVDGKRCILLLNSKIYLVMCFFNIYFSINNIFCYITAEHSFSLSFNIARSHDNFGTWH